MASQHSTDLSLFVALLLPLLLSAACLQCHCLNIGSSDHAETTTTKLYVVYMGEKQHNDPDLVTAIHHETLSSVLGSKDAAMESIVYSYRHGFSGFAARLTHAQAKQLAGLAGVLSVTPSRVVKATTTRSWDFLGLSLNKFNNMNHPSKQQLLHKANMGEGVIVGVVDSGIWPESKSFSDKGFGAIPSRWKGTCQPGQRFNASHCNRKLIGARWYPQTAPPNEHLIKAAEYMSPRDANDHGTHVASTIAGNVVRGANFHGLGAGRARGGAPRARLAMYKALWGSGRPGVEASGDDATVVKAIDDAIHDGVDVLSLSIGGSPGFPSGAHESWATLHAVQKGITVLYSAGNDGPAPESMENHFPWAITVAASTTDRIFPTAITLGGSNRTIVGQAIYWRTKKKTKRGDSNGFKELYYDVDDRSCNSPNASLVNGTIVICDMGDAPSKQFGIAGSNVVKAGGAGMIFVRYTTNIPVECLDFPCAVVDLESRQHIIEHVIRTGDERAKISLTRTALTDGFSPRVAAFSSRGPSAVVPSVLKLGLLTKLTTFGAATTGLSRRIPPQFDNLVNLHTLALYDTDVSGAVPAELGSFSELRYLYLHMNKIDDVIPPELGKLQKLTSLLFWGNSIYGALLKELHLSDNSLTGAIPWELSNCTSLTTLQLDKNSLSGPIPPQVGDLKFLQILFLWGNSLSGRFPRRMLPLPVVRRDDVLLRPRPDHGAQVHQDGGAGLRDPGLMTMSIFAAWILLNRNRKSAAAEKALAAASSSGRDDFSYP